MGNNSSRRFEIGRALVLVALVLGARPAGAASVNDFYLGPELGGPQQGTFGPNQVIHFSGKNRFINACREMEGINDFVYPAGDVYVIAGGSTPGSGAKLKDEGGAPSTVIETTNAGFQDEILGSRFRAVSSERALTAWCSTPAKTASSPPKRTTFFRTRSRSSCRQSCPRSRPT